jgi:hypothetical protein
MRRTAVRQHRRHNFGMPTPEQRSISTGIPLPGNFPRPVYGHRGVVIFGAASPLWFNVARPKAHALALFHSSAVSV